MSRLRYNGLAATLANALADVTTAVTFTAPLTHAGGAVPTIGQGDFIPLSILNAAGLPVEVVYLTAYTAGATTGTVLRGQEGTTAAARAAGLTFVNSPTVADFSDSGSFSSAEVIEFSAAVSSGTNTVAPPVVVDSGTTDPTICTASTAGTGLVELVFPAAGVYSINAHLLMGTAPNTRFLLAISDERGVEFARATVASSENSWSTYATLHVFAGGRVDVSMFRDSGSGSGTLLIQAVRLGGGDSGDAAPFRYARTVCASGSEAIPVGSSAPRSVLSFMGSPIRASVSAEVGDVVEVSLNCQLADDISGFVDLGASTYDPTTNAELNQVPSPGASAVPGWGFRNYASFDYLSGSILYVVQGSDIVNGVATFGLTGFYGAAARSLFAGSAAPLVFSVKNFGP